MVKNAKSSLSLSLVLQKICLNYLLRFVYQPLSLLAASSDKAMQLTLLLVRYQVPLFN